MRPDKDAKARETIALGHWRVEFWHDLGSTNDEARARAIAGDGGRLWIVADQQSQGRGRHGRTWASPPGNLYASALVVDPCEPALAPQLGFVAGVAARRAVADLGVEARLKWPNDLVVGDAKLCGLLVEGVTPPGRRLAAVVGIGVNVASSPAGLAYPTTCLNQLASSPCSPRALLERLARRFDEALSEWARGAGFAAIREAWLAGAAGLGRPIRVVDSRGPRDGAFLGLDPRGRLLLDRDGMIEIIESADVVLVSGLNGASAAS